MVFSPKYLLPILALVLVSYVDRASASSGNPSPGSYRPFQTAQAGGVKFENSGGPSCEGITVFRAGDDMFRGAIPAKFVDVRNSSDRRKEVTLDIRYRLQGRNALGSYDEGIWEAYGPFVIRPREEGRYYVRRGDPRHERRRIEEVRVVKCSD